MQLISVLAIIVAIAAASPAQKLFEQFQADFNKVYTTEEEKAFRFTVFEKTLKRIAELNQGEEFAPHGINKFADMTQEEFSAAYLMPKATFAGQVAKFAQAPLLELVESALPTTFGWNSTYVTPVKNQEQCGSCWAFSTTENIESVWAIAGNPLVVLAPQQIVDCDTVDQGCDGGWPYDAYEYVIGAGGLELEKSYPYTAADGTCKAKKSLEVAKIASYAYATKTKNETQMQLATYNTAPLSICVDATTWQTYTSGIITKNCGTQIDHCVQIVGWGQQGAVNYWEVRNSWGTTWGEDGFIRVEMGKNLCAIAEQATTSAV
jgi:C1A family cysteine protease